jgi:hypothetical protein
MWFAVAISGSGTEHSVRLIVLLLLLLALGGLLEHSLLSKFYRYRRRPEVLARVARQMGCTFSASMDLPADGLHLLQHCLGGKCKNVITYNAAGREAKVFDYDYFVDCGDFMGKFQHTVAAFRVPTAALPEVYIHPATPLERIGLLRGARVGTYVVACEGDPLRPPFCAKIAQLPGKWWIEHVKDWLFIYRPNTLVRPEEFPQFIAEAEAITQKLLAAATATATAAG